MFTDIFLWLKDRELETRCILQEASMSLVSEDWHRNQINCSKTLLCLQSSRLQLSYVADTTNINFMLAGRNNVFIRS